MAINRDDLRCLLIEIAAAEKSAWRTEEGVQLTFAFSDQLFRDYLDALKQISGRTVRPTLH